LKVSFSPRSLAQLEEVHRAISDRNPAAARDVIRRIQALCSGLADFPNIGTTTDQPGVLVLPVVRYPYAIFYKVLEDQDAVRILRIRHTSRRVKVPKG
jgi:toxin ParE1/3/4